VNDWRVWGPRVAAPAAFLLAATAGVLAVRSANSEDSTPPPVATPTAAPETTAPTPRGLEQFHIVREGDTLATIAEENGTTVERLLELNPGIDPVALPVGARIRVA
jgi:LysM repeat protein